ncbi:13977_t:CDS:2 [Funneliformis mosseae]|uniref:13977_t:CDS:1 n=1 Tax=Funneliformis mosseae TaxID=27381 RepID=A0A9N8W1K4_FUNMO|nr:13977_t:CDS:2 [Funneliformis mosseae]
MSSTNKPSHVLADLCITPMGVEPSTKDYIKECVTILQKSSLNYNVHANGTNFEGNFDQVMSTIRKCVERMHEMGVPRCETSIRLNTRVDKSITMHDSIRSVANAAQG